MAPYVEQVLELCLIIPADDNLGDPIRAKAIAWLGSVTKVSLVQIVLKENILRVVKFRLQMIFRSYLFKDNIILFLLTSNFQVKRKALANKKMLVPMIQVLFKVVCEMPHSEDVSLETVFVQFFST